MAYWNQGQTKSFVEYDLFVLFCFFTRDYREMTLIQEVEAYLPKLIQTCCLSSGRSIAHKCSRLLMMCAR